jgi:predicted metal-dependent hydrolase
VKDIDPRYAVGIQLFNREEFFEAHEIWEDLWHNTYGINKDFFQGLIQVTSAMHHLQIGNMRGARILYGSGIQLLAPYGTRHLGLDLEELRTHFTRTMNPLLIVPAEKLSGRGGKGTLKIPYSSDLSFKLKLEFPDDFKQQ